MKEHSTAQQRRRAFLVGVALPSQPAWEVEEHLDELAELTTSALLEVAGRAVQSRKSPHRKTYIGPGKAEEIANARKQLKANLVVFDDDLAPSQARALEDIFGCQVLDRSGLILEIFSLRAQTKEAKTQVELARCEYLLPRLTRRWSHLSRQVGGIGVRGGEGETQLEADRRMLRKEIGTLKKELRKIEQTREVQRRNRAGAAVVALVGYTNAGKSTLFNALTGGSAMTQDRLFATLDSKLRRGWLPGEDGRGTTVVFADTVGFIRKLPHHLVASFRSTLGEIVHADLVLHVVDRSHPQWRDHLKVGEEVLTDLGVELDQALVVFNKCDRLDRPGPADGLWVSAKTGDGLDALRVAVAARLEGMRNATSGDAGPESEAHHPAEEDRLRVDSA